MSNPYDTVKLSNCFECGKVVDLVEASKYMSTPAKDHDDPAWCEDCWYKAKCAECGKDVKLSVQVYCSCTKYFWSYHEDLVWCSQECLSNAHSGPEPEENDI